MVSFNLRAETLKFEISFTGDIALGFIEFYVGGEAESAANARKMECNGNVLTAEIEESESGFYILTSIIQGGQVNTPLYVSKGTREKHLDAELADGCFVVVTNDADCRALTTLGHLQGMQTRRLWTDVKTEEEAKTLLSGYKELLLLASSQQPAAKVVKQYMDIWAYTVNYVNITNIPHILGKKPSEVALRPSDLMPKAASVMDSELALNMQSAAFVICDGLKQYSSLDKKIAALHSQYHTEAVVQKIEKYLREEYAQHATIAVGTPFPEDVKLVDRDGERMAFSQFRGKYVYVDFWASWCVPCCREVPYLQKLEQEVSNPDVVFLSISIDTSEAPWLDKMNTLNMHGNQWLNADNEVCKALNINSIPHFAIYDKDGRLLVYNAYRPSSGEKIKELLERLR